MEASEPPNNNKTRQLIISKDRLLLGDSEVVTGGKDQKNHVESEIEHESKRKMLHRR